MSRACLAALIALWTGSEAGSFADSVAHYQRKLAAGGAAYGDSLSLARALSFERRFAEALALFGPLLASRPDDRDARLARARALAWSGDRANALVDARRARDEDPASGEAWRLLGDLARWDGRHDSAVAAYGEVLEKAPGDREVLAARAQSHQALGNAAAARADRLAAGVPEPPSQVPAPASLAKRPWKAIAAWTGEYGGELETPWQSVTATGKWESARSALAASAFGARRYGGWDPGFGLDGYAPAWRKAYVNLWMQAAPGSGFLPRLDYRGEVFQGLSHRAEISASFRQMRFSAAEVELYGTALAAYLGPWYARIDGILALAEAATVSGLATGRRYFGEGGDFAEFKAGFGEAGAPWSAGRIGGSEGGFFLGARLQKTMANGIGGTAGLRGGREDGPGAFLELEVGAFAGFGAPLLQDRGRARP